MTIAAVCQREEWIGDAVPYQNWRMSGIPSFRWQPLAVDLSGIPEEERAQVRERCVERYRAGNEVFDQAIADAALRYVFEDGNIHSRRTGPLFRMAVELSLRYLELYTYSALYDMEKGIPMLPVDAGQLKSHGFTAAEILRLQGDCRRILPLLERLKESVPLSQFEECIAVLADSKKRKTCQDPQFEEVIKTFEDLPELDLVEGAIACLLAAEGPARAFGGIREIAEMKPNFAATLKERILMEIRQRVGGDGSRFMRNPGSIGQNPLAYYNLLLKGEPEDPRAEFRNRMYFVYMNKFFTDELFRDQVRLNYINDRLRRTCGWQVRPEFVDAMLARKPKSKGPLFRLGAYAALNPWIRESVRQDAWFERNPRLLDVMRGDRLGTNDSFRYPFTRREIMGQTGDYEVERTAPERRVEWRSGADYFRMRDLEEIDDTPGGQAAKQYLSMCRELELPLLSSISGTFDCMAAMAGFVDAALSKEELQTFKLAMIAFMAPGRDHSVQEVLESSRSYGLPYEPGPGFERCIYPAGGDRFLALVREEMQRRREEMPSHYLTAEYANFVYHRMYRGALG